MTQKNKNKLTNGSSRRDVLKKIGVTGASATGIAGFSGSAVAQDGWKGKYSPPGNETDNASIESGAPGELKGVQLFLTSASKDSKQLGGYVQGTWQPEDGKPERFKQSFQTADFTVTQTTQAVAFGVEPTCDVLNLTIGPITLSLLGLDLFLGGGGRDDPSPIVLDLNANPDEGLLGDILCTLAQ